MKFLKHTTLLVALFCIAATSPFQKKFKAPKSFTYVTKGKATIGEKSKMVEAFYISKTEVTNGEYNHFLSELTDEKQAQMAAVQSENWVKNYAYSEPFAKTYANHPAYEAYPVVNISYEGAQLYCEWLTKNYYKNNPKTSKQVEYRLPTRSEWIRAARLDNPTVYTWTGRELSNDKGSLLCNFKRLEQNNVRYDEKTGEVINLEAENKWHAEHTHITSPSITYLPNEIGAYNMCGNVSEMVAEKGVAVGGNYTSGGFDVRIESTINYTEATPFIGFRPILVVK